MHTVGASVIAEIILKLRRFESRLEISQATIQALRTEVLALKELVL